MSQRELQLILTLKDNLSKEVDKINGSLKTMEPSFKKMALIGTAAFAGIAVGIGKTVKDAVDLGESVNAVQVIFKNASNQILEFGKTSYKSVGLSNAAFNQMSTITGALLKDTGLSMDQVAGKTIDLTKRAADMASVFNTDVNDAMSAINQAIRGETEAIRRYAGDVTDATLEQYLMSIGINKSVTELSAQEKRLYRVDLIMKQTSDTMNDFSNTSDSLANRQRVVGAQIEDISAKLGATFIPIISQVLNYVQPLIDRFAAWASQHPELIKNITLAALALAGLVAALGFVGLAAIAVTAALSPVSLVLIGIIAVLAALTAAWTTNFLGIRDVTVMALNFIRDQWNAWGKDTWNALKATFLVIAQVFKAGIDVLSTIFAGFYLLFTGKWGALWELIKSGAKGGWDNIKGIFSSAVDAIKANITAISSFFTSKFDDMWNKAKDIAEKIRHAISDAFDKDKRNSPSISDMLNTLNATVTHKLGDIQIGASNFATDTRHAISSGFTAPQGGVGGNAGGPSISLVISGNTLLDQNAAEQIGNLMIQKLRLNYQQ